MDEENYQDFQKQAIYLRKKRFRLSAEPSQDEISRFLEVENAVEKFLFNITVSGGAEAGNVLELQNIVGGACQKEEMQRALFIKESGCRKK